MSVKVLNQVKYNYVITTKFKTLLRAQERIFYNPCLQGANPQTRELTSTQMSVIQVRSSKC